MFVLLKFVHLFDFSASLISFKPQVYYSLHNANSKSLGGLFISVNIENLIPLHF